MYTTSLLILTPVLASGCVLCIQDWRTLSVSFIPLLIFFSGSFCYYLAYGNFSLLLFLIIFCVGLFTKILLKRDIIGVADYLVSIAVAPFLCNSEVPILLILIGCIGIFASILRKNTIIPFVSVILFASLLLRLFKGLI